MASCAAGIVDGVKMVTVVEVAVLGGLACAGVAVVVVVAMVVGAIAGNTNCGAVVVVEDEVGCVVVEGSGIAVVTVLLVDVAVGVVVVVVDVVDVVVVDVLAVVVLVVVVVLAVVEDEEEVGPSLAHCPVKLMDCSRPLGEVFV